MLAGTVNHMWVERNNKVFKNNIRKFETIVKNIIIDVRLRLMSLLSYALPNFLKSISFRGFL